MVRNEVALIALEEALHDAYGDLATVCKQLEVKVGDVHRWMVADPEVASRIKAAQTLGWSQLESAAHQRAVVGVEEPVYQKGELVGYKTVYSDSLLIAMMKARVPAYKADGHGGGSNVAVQVNLMPRADTYEQWIEQRDRTLNLPPPELVEDATFEEIPDTAERLANRMGGTFKSALKDIL